MPRISATLFLAFACAASAHSIAQTARVSGGVIAGNRLTAVAPVYPPIAKAAHVGGTVVLHAIISKSGNVERLEAISGPDMLKGAALDAVRQWTYKPYLLNGEPTDVDTTITVNFNLNDPTAPTKIPKDIQMIKEDPAPGPQSSGVMGMSGMAGGSAGGVMGGVSGGSPVVVARPAQYGPARLSGGVVSGNRLTYAPPVYPAIAKAAHVTGSVVLHAIISKEGTVERLEAISGPDMLKQAAIDAVRQWTYKPYLLNGEPTEVDTTITVNFNLNGG
jgi:TonB family protein